MQGNDVKSVQRAPAKANIPIDQDGVYSPTTAAAVAQFQKQNGLNVSGVVDIATRRWLGLPADMPRQAISSTRPDDRPPAKRLGRDVSAESTIQSSHRADLVDEQFGLDRDLIAPTHPA